MINNTISTTNTKAISETLFEMHSWNIHETENEVFNIHFINTHNAFWIDCASCDSEGKMRICVCM